MPGECSRAVDERGEPVSEYTALRNFWKKYNKVLLESLAAEKEQHELEAENEQLKGLLQQYLDGISVNEEILSKANSLLIVNGRTNVAR